MTVAYEWRGPFENAELDALHSEAFGPERIDSPNIDWTQLAARHSLGWVAARDTGRLIGFVNVLWDGRAHAWLQDAMVASSTRRWGIGTALIAEATDGARRAGCQWLHVDFEEPHRPFYLESCAFRPTAAGILALQAEPPGTR